MQVKEIYPKLYLLKFDSRQELAMTFMRLQEFYESPYPQIKHRYFTWEQLLDCYTRNGKMTYCAEFCGFNVPGEVIGDFFWKFVQELTNKEKGLFQIIKKLMKKHGKDFYLIGIHNAKDIQHEYAHGLFYLNKEYRREVTKLVKGFSKTYFKKLCSGLAKQGYCEDVFIDEIQAYAIDRKQRKFVQLFKKYRNRLT